MLALAWLFYIFSCLQFVCSIKCVCCRLFVAFLIYLATFLLLLSPGQLSISSHCGLLSFTSPSPTGKKFRSKPQLARYLGNQMDLSSFDFRTGKMLMSKLNKNRQRLRYDNNNQTKVRGLSPEINISIHVGHTLLNDITLIYCQTSS